MPAVKAKTKARGKTSRSSKGATATRLPAEEAKARILRATEKRLLEVGPQGLRLQEIARDVGLSHPTVLHHFGSREELVAAVAMRAMETLEADLLACFSGLQPSSDALAVTKDTLDRIDAALRRHGHARVLAWLALTGLAPPKGSSLLRDLAHVIHGARSARREGVSLDHTMFSVLLTSAAMFGLAIVGPDLLSMLGVAETEEVHQRFRAWFAEVLVAEAGV